MFFFTHNTLLIALVIVFNSHEAKMMHFTLTRNSYPDKVIQGSCIVVLMSYLRNWNTKCVIEHKIFMSGTPDMHNANTNMFNKTIQEALFMIDNYLRRISLKNGKQHTQKALVKSIQILGNILTNFDIK